MTGFDFDDHETSESAAVSIARHWTISDEWFGLYQYIVRELVRSNGKTEVASSRRTILLADARAHIPANAEQLERHPGDPETLLEVWA